MEFCDNCDEFVFINDIKICENCNAYLCQECCVKCKKCNTYYCLNCSATQMAKDKCVSCKNKNCSTL